MASYLFSLIMFLAGLALARYNNMLTINSFGVGFFSGVIAMSGFIYLKIRQFILRTEDESNGVQLRSSKEVGPKGPKEPPT